MYVQVCYLRDGDFGVHERSRVGVVLRVVLEVHPAVQGELRAVVLSPSPAILLLAVGDRLLSRQSTLVADVDSDAKRAN